MNYINFILEHSKNTHRRRCSMSEVWGSWSWLFSYHDSDSILSASTAVQHPSITEMPYEQAATLANSCLGPGYWDKLKASRHPDRP
ncbi:hypothetical protein Zmor_015368 [Zophobas morio]|uniref:Uncharacterized protein n=1 Tax=Zophobas morio TaxID=2755281 RepID=A0AA38IJA7_9CUCU|nr:hypothetical protein Zmor_015368 [Zophobas morio]